MVSKSSHSQKVALSGRRKWKYSKNVEHHSFHTEEYMLRLRGKELACLKMCSEVRIRLKLTELWDMRSSMTKTYFVFKQS